MPSLEETQVNSYSAHYADNSTNTTRPRVILLLDLDCFYAQSECVRLGYNAAETSLALLQWNSVLAVSYPARSKYGIKRGDSWALVREKSNGKCLAVHVPILSNIVVEESAVASIGGGGGGGVVDSGDGVDNNGLFEGKVKASWSPLGKETLLPNDNGNGSNNDDTSALLSFAIPDSLQQDYATIFNLTPAQQQVARRESIGVRKHSHEGKACIERYRVSSAKVFEAVHGWIADQNSGIVLERASIDEFFLDVTAACYAEQAATATTTATSWDDEPQALAHTVQIGPESDQKAFVGENADTNDPDLRAVYHGCTLASRVRQAVFDQLGFTLSAGISTNKTLAKLSASYGKPVGQAVTFPFAIDDLLHQTPINKCRNLGGKFGQKVQALLPSNAPPTVGSIGRYLSLPELKQGLRDHSTAAWVFNMSRGIDREVVAPKTNTTALTKSITAFKSLPVVKGGHSITAPATVQWIELLAKEVVMRVEQDAARNCRYPRSCGIHYAQGVEPGETLAPHRKKSTSIRMQFPPQRLSVTQRIDDFVKRVPELIRAKEGAKFTIHRVGLCAIDFTDRESTNAIENYFTVSAPASNKRVADGDEETAPAQSRRTETTAKRVAPVVDHDMEMAIKLQASYDRERAVLQVLEKKGAATSATATNKQDANGDEEPAPTRRTETRANTVTPVVDHDLEMARKLQANFDRELAVLQVLDKKGAHTSRPAKTRRIDTFFTKR